MSATLSAILPTSIPLAFKRYSTYNLKNVHYFTNGLLPQYFPKGIDFRKATEEDLAIAIKKLNHRPRKCLGYQSPHEVFWSSRNGALAT
ncbi:MAG: hypothetical protein WAL98_14095 [Desulfatiglandaceae bacterium]